MKNKTKGIWIGILIAALGLGIAGGLSMLTKGFTDWTFADISVPGISISDTSSDTSSDISSDTSSEDPIELSYSITFSPATTTNIALDAPNFKGIASEDAQLMSYNTIEKIYREAPDAIKFGTTTVMGILSFTLPDNLQVLSIVVEAKTYTNDATIMLANGVEQTLSDDYAEYEFDFEVLDTATIELRSKNVTSDRFYVRSITIVHSDQPIPEPEEPVYHRIEAERYEFVFPYMVNGDWTFGWIHTAVYSIDESYIAGLFVSLDDADGLNTNEYIAELAVFADGSALNAPTLEMCVQIGEYGRYIVSDSQVADEPVSFILEPIYDYILAE